MGTQPFHSLTTRRALATWLALFVLFWQTLLSAGVIERPMAPVQFTDAGIAICTDHGLETLPADGGAPVHAPDHSAPPCPCCLSFTAGNATILPEAAVLASPDWIAADPIVPATAAAPTRFGADGPHQPRAPPLSI